MFYNFEKTKEIKPIDNTYNLLNPIDLYEKLSNIWSMNTCAPRMRNEWSIDNKTLGQCSITAFLVQDIFGGDVYGIKIDNNNYHCFNVINNIKFDLTSEQFNYSLDYDNCIIQSRDIHFSKIEKYDRYNYLKNELLKAIKK